MKKIKSLVLMHVGTNTGYAIEPLERLFHRVCMELGPAAPDTVHFAFCDMVRGAPTSVPDGTPVVTFNAKTATPADHERLCAYVAKHEIEFALFFDIQPVDPVFRALRRGGVSTILAYWGAPISGPQPLLKRLAKRLLFGFSRSKLDGMVFESQAMADLAIYGRGVPAEIIDVIPLGIDISRYQPHRTDYVYEVLPVARDRKIVVYAGHMEERKGVRSLVHSAIELLTVRKRQDVAFLLFGNKNDESAVYESLYAGLGIEQHIIFGGYRPDLAECFPGCFIGVIPSSGWDSFPRTSMELAACGLPLVVSRLGGLPECVAEGETGLIFPPGDHLALADHIEHLLEHPDEATHMGQRGRIRCEREYTIPVQEERLLAVCRRWLSRRKTA